MNVDQRKALDALAPAGHGAAEGRASPIHRVAECSCGWRQQFPRRGRNALAVTSQIHGAIRAHYIDVAKRAQ